MYEANKEWGHEMRVDKNITMSQNWLLNGSLINGSAEFKVDFIVFFSSTILIWNVDKKTIVKVIWNTINIIVLQQEYNY